MLIPNKRIGLVKIMSQSDYLQTTQTQYEAQVRAHVLEGVRVQEFLASHRQSFRGSLQVDDLNVSLPEQTFSFHRTKTGGYIENHPTSHFPRIRIDLIFDSLNETIGVGDFQVEFLGGTIEAGLLVTRLLFALSAAGRCYLRDSKGNNLLEMSVGKLFPEETEDLLYKAKLFRKLRFIEELFRTRFTLPSIYTPKDVETIEIVFRGITEGEFTSRVDDITFNYTPSEDDLNKPPITKPGPISTTFSDPDLVIFGKKILVGPVMIHLERAGLTNPEVISSLRKGEQQSINLSLIVFDLQIKYRFDKYASRPQQSLRRKLEQFKMKLLNEEPVELVEMLTDNLIMDVTAERAHQIVTGWLQFYGFPDRYCAQEPKLEGDSWRVPIWITYSHGRGGRVDDAFVHLKTGVITVPVSVEELRELGKSVALEVLRAS